MAYVLKSKEKSHKLDSKSDNVVFIGYGQNHFGYKLWDFEKEEVSRAKNVIYAESELF